MLLRRSKQGTGLFRTRMNSLSRSLKYIRKMAADFPIILLLHTVELDSHPQKKYPSILNNLLINDIILGLYFIATGKWSALLTSVDSFVVSLCHRLQLLIFSLQSWLLVSPEAAVVLLSLFFMHVAASTEDEMALSWLWPSLEMLCLFLAPSPHLVTFLFVYFTLAMSCTLFVPGGVSFSGCSSMLSLCRCQPFSLLVLKKDITGLCAVVTFFYLKEIYVTRCATHKEIIYPKMKTQSLSTLPHAVLGKFL